MSVAAEFIALLETIDKKLDKLLAASGVGGAIADDADLDSQYGDPLVKFMPRDWHGTDYKGCNYSTTDPEFLGMLADALEFFAGRATEANKKQWNLRDAARARGWKRRLESGWKSPKAQTSSRDEEPF